MNAVDPARVRRGWRELTVAERAAVLMTLMERGDARRGRLARTIPRGDVVAWELAGDPSAVPYARAQVRQWLGLWGLGDLADSVELLVSELVTNAVVHGGGRVGLRLVRGDRLLCEVADEAPGAPRPRVAEDTDERGRGLLLVSALAERWGTRPTRRGKVVWFEVVPGKSLDSLDSLDGEERPDDLAALG